MPWKAQIKCHCPREFITAEICNALRIICIEPLQELGCRHLGGGGRARWRCAKWIDWKNDKQDSLNPRDNNAFKSSVAESSSDDVIEINMMRHLFFRFNAWEPKLLHIPRESKIEIASGKATCDMVPGSAHLIKIWDILVFVYCCMSF
jgi:hypothetical protein